ncbi:MAG: substrate-binding domain-containing protein [Boseongicola sp. SB0673_bin_14]|nr:substrate-binding domain-containing protein [Boseongicola sp. SB0673_bin_14]
MTIVGLGPHGEQASPPERVTLLPQDIADARRRDLRVALIMHTMDSDWAKQLVQGVIGTLGDSGVTVMETVDCAFSPKTQIGELGRTISAAPDAVISLPVENAAVAEAHRKVTEAGIKLFLLDNAPTGLLPGKDYVSLISADNFGLGRIAAEMLSVHSSESGTVGLIGYDADFFATNERELAFSRWMQINRPDLKVETRRFAKFSDVSTLTADLVAQHADLCGLFVAWDTPCIQALDALKTAGINLPVVTGDLGAEVAASLATGGPVVGVAAQRPFQQGEAAARAAITELLGRKCPDWLALPGLAVTSKNVNQSYQAIWRMPAPNG